MFLKSQSLKFMDTVKFKTGQLTFKIQQNEVPDYKQKMFKDREGTCQLRSTFMLKQPPVRTILKSMCSLWGDHVEWAK